MSRAIRLALLTAVPVAPALHYLLGVAPIWVFVTGILGVGVLADWIRAATEQLAKHTGPAMGGLLTVSLGSLAELLLALFVLARGEQASGARADHRLDHRHQPAWPGAGDRGGRIARERQSFKRERAGLLSSLLMLAVIALLLPAVFDFTAAPRHPAPDLAVSEEALSLVVSSVLLLLYCGQSRYHAGDASGRVLDRRRRTRTDRPGRSGYASRAGRRDRRRGAGERTHLGRADRRGQHAAPVATFMGVIVLALGGDGRRPVRRRLVRAAGPDGAGDEHLHRIGDPGGAGRGAVTGASCPG